MLRVGLSALFFAVIGVVLIVRRKEMAEGLGLLFGASTPPGCAVAVGIVFFALAIAAVVLYQLGLLGDF